MVDTVRRLQVEEFLKAKFPGITNAHEMTRDTKSKVPLTAARDWFNEQITQRRFSKDENQKCIEEEMKIWSLAIQDDVCFWIEAPKYHYDDQGRCHHSDGPAIVSSFHEWYFWHGVEVPKKVILSPEAITAEEIDSEQNNETKRVMIERYPGGWDRFLRQRGKLIEKRRNERDGQIEMLFSHKKEVMFVVTDPSTGRRYALRVPVTIKTCEEAQLWLSHGLDSRAIHRS